MSEAHIRRSNKVLTTQYTQGTGDPGGEGGWGRCWEDGDSVMDKILNNQEICDYVVETSTSYRKN